MSIAYLIGAAVLGINIFIGLMAGTSWILVKIFNTDEDNTIAAVTIAYVYGGGALGIYLNSQGII